MGETGKELVKVGRSPVAASFQDWGPGKILYVDSRGRALSPSAAARAWGFAYARIALVIGAATSVIWWAGQPAIGLAYGAVAGAWLTYRTVKRQKHVATILRTAELAGAGRMEEAHAGLSKLLETHRRSPLRIQLILRLAAVELQLARPREALTRLDDFVARRRRLGPDLAGDMADNLRASALIHLDRFDEARKVIAEFSATESELITTGQRSARVSLAFHSGAPGDLPAEGDLHDWAHDALGLSAFGGLLILLSWAFHRHGDDDMAKHLLAEAPPRMPAWPLEKHDPKLHAWMSEKMRAWQIE